MGAYPSADTGEGIRFPDELKGFLVPSIGDEIDVSLDIDPGRAVLAAGWTALEGDLVSVFPVHEFVSRASEKVIECFVVMDHWNSSEESVRSGYLPLTEDRTMMTEMLDFPLEIT